MAAALEELRSTTAAHRDRERQLQAEAAASHRGWTDMRRRVARYDDVIVPAAAARTAAALAAYEAARTELAAVLDARRAALDVSLLRLELQMEILRRLVELRFLAS